MLFNSIAFSVFVSIIFILYWFITSKNLSSQNFLLLVASYFFYAWWDWRFLLLLFFVSLANYSVGLLIQKESSKKRKKTWLITGIVINIAVLSFFKYFEFFIDSFLHLFSTIGFTLQKPTLNIILPLGISFYIFFSLSYLIDIYRSKLSAVSNLFDVLLTLSFFPIIFAGPIQRPILLLPQIQRKRIFQYNMAVDGLKQILWGLFMKIVIADHCAAYVNDIFRNFNNENGSTLFLGGILYSVQIYADFAGYSEIAIGVAKLFGFELIRNFKYPYFAKDITEFWRRWHISLTSWFRDYVFLPIAYYISRKISTEKMAFIKTDLIIYTLGILITWFLTGLWHGGNFTFLIWGFFHGFLLIAYHIQKKPRKTLLKKLKISNDNPLLIGFEWTLTFILIVFAWIMFRSENLSNALKYIAEIFSSSLLSVPKMPKWPTIFLIVLFFILEWYGRNQQYAISNLGNNWKKPLQWAMYYILILTIFYFAEKEESFIYFQF